MYDRVSLLLTLFAFLPLHRLSLFHARHVLATFLLQEQHCFRHALILLTALLLNENGVPHLVLFGLVVLSLFGAQLVQSLQLIMHRAATLAQHLQLNGAVVHFLLVVLGPNFLLVLQMLDALVQESVGPFVHRRFHFLSFQQAIQFLHQLVFHLRMDAEQRLLSGTELFLLKLELNVTNGLVLLQLFFQLFDFLVGNLSFLFMVSALSLQLCL
eukprot:Skav216083  [mRNA]  locus=scaffold2042:47548:53049:- [translate_table: standard]